MHVRGGAREGVGAGVHLSAIVDARHTRTYVC